MSKNEHEDLMKRSFEEDFHLENGEYCNTCVVCGANFIGYKRRVVCKLCLKPLDTEVK